MRDVKLSEERKPVETVDDLGTLDMGEMIEGYRDAREGWPCGENRSRAYWHGWQNGMADSYKMDITPAMRKLTESVQAAGRLALSKAGGPEPE